MSSDEENDNFNEDHIINLISVLQQKSIPQYEYKVKSSRQHNDNLRQTKDVKNCQPDFSLQESKHSSISENLSDLIVRTDKVTNNEESTCNNNDDMVCNQSLLKQHIKEQLNLLLNLRQQDRELMDSMQDNILHLTFQLERQKQPPKKQQCTIATQTTQNTQPTQSTKYSPTPPCKSAQQSIQHMIHDPDRGVFDEIRNFCFKRGQQY